MLHCIASFCISDDNINIGPTEHLDQPTKASLLIQIKSLQLDGFFFLIETLLDKCLILYLLNGFKLLLNVQHFGYNLYFKRENKLKERNIPFSC